MNAKQSAVVAAIRAGASIDEAAARVGVNVHTLRRWLSTGRKNPDGPYGPFAALVDRLKDRPRGPKEHARSFILALVAFTQSGSDDDGRSLQASVRSIPPGTKDQVMADLADHFLVSLIRQMNEGSTRDDVFAACEEMFQEVDAVHELRERAR